MSSQIESVLSDTRVFPPSAAFVKQANISGMDAYRKLVAEAEKDFEGYWARLAREHLLWHKPFTQVLNESNAPFYKWFEDGVLNVSYNCLDKHLATQAEKTAIIFEADDGKVRVSAVDDTRSAVVGRRREAAGITIWRYNYYQEERTRRAFPVLPVDDSEAAHVKPAVNAFEREWFVC